MTHVNVREVLESLTLAKEAYDAVPDMRRQIDDLQAAVASKDRLLSQTNANLQEIIQGKANVEAKLKEVESERDAYGFRAIDAEEKLEKVFGVVRPATPPIQPQVSEVGQSATDPTMSSVEQPLESGTLVDPIKGQSAVPSFQEPLTTTGTTASIDDIKGQSVTDPTKAGLGVTEPMVNPTQDWGQSASHPTAQTAFVQSGVNTSDVAKSSDQSFTTQSDHGDESHAVIDKPYLGHPSWEKPHDMNWNEWEAKGGTVPGWMKSAH